MTALQPDRHPASIEAEQAQLHGYRVFNVSIKIDASTGKKTAVYPAHWSSESTLDPSILPSIDRLRGYGIDCGASGIVAVDLDKTTAVDGVALWRERGLPVSPLRVTTQGGGVHMLFRADPAVPMSIANLGKLGVDVRGDGGLLYGAGTEVAGGGRYAMATPWLRPEQLPVVPTAALKALYDENAALKRAAAAKERPALFAVTTGDQVAQCQQHVDQHFALLEQSVDGGFNDALNRYCYWVGRLFATWDVMGEPGDLSIEAAEQYVVDAMCDSAVMDPPDANDRKTIRSSGLRGGMKAPFTAPVEPRTVEDIWKPPPGDFQPLAGVEATGQGERRGWDFEDLGPYLDGSYVAPKATALVRADGQHLLYPERVNWIQGESESGKSWVGQIACAQAALAGLDSLYVDFESNPGEVVNRWRLLGLEPDTIKTRIRYIRPDSPARLSENFATVLSHRYAVLVMDGVTDALGVEGKSMMDNDEVAGWIRTVLRPLATHTGAAVVCIDHVTKSKDERGRFAIGAQSKMAGLSGAAYVCEVRQQLGVGLCGVIELRVAKDRPGTIRAVSVDYRPGDRTAAVATLTLDASGDPRRIGFEVTPAVEGTLNATESDVDLPWDPLSPPTIGLVLENTEGYQLASGHKFLGRDGIRPLAQYMASEAASGAGRTRAEATAFFTRTRMLSESTTKRAWDRLLECGALKASGGGGSTGKHTWMGAVEIVPDEWIKT